MLVVTVSLGALFLVAMALGVIGTATVLILGLLAEDLLAFLKEGQYSFKVEVIPTSTSIANQTVIRSGETLLPPMDDEDC